MFPIFDNLLSFLFPRRCPFCGAVVEKSAHMCENCAAKVPFITGEICPRCGRNKNFCVCRGKNYHFARCTAPFYYEGAVRSGILHYKFFAKRESAADFAFYMAQTVRRAYAGEKFSFVTCVPLTKKEKKKRGFNQSELLARELARQLSLPYRDALLKPRDIAPQSKLSGRERQSNVSGAFCAVAPVEKENILLVDDIMTTGATLDDCARALLSAGAKRIDCAVIACTKPHFHLLQ